MACDWSTRIGPKPPPYYELMTDNTRAARCKYWFIFLATPMFLSCYFVINKMKNNVRFFKCNTSMSQINILTNQISKLRHLGAYHRTRLAKMFILFKWMWVCVRHLLRIYICTKCAVIFTQAPSHHIFTWNAAFSSEIKHNYKFVTFLA